MCATRLLLYSVTILLLSDGVCAQRNAGGSAGKAVYFLKDDAHQEWCGYASEARFRALIQPMQAMVVGRVDYTEGRVSAVLVTEEDETGDWSVNDEYSLGQDGRVRALKRTINVIPEDVREVQEFTIRNGKAYRTGDSYRELSSGKPTENRADWFEPPPVITSLENFPFFGLVVGKQNSVWTSGEACVPAK